MAADAGFAGVGSLRHGSGEIPKKLSAKRDFFGLSAATSRS
jgi:hypothetical protein